MPRNAILVLLLGLFLCSGCCFSCFEHGRLFVTWPCHRTPRIPSPFLCLSCLFARSRHFIGTLCQRSQERLNRPRKSRSGWAGLLQGLRGHRPRASLLGLATSGPATRRQTRGVRPISARMPASPCSGSSSGRPGLPLTRQTSAPCCLRRSGRTWMCLYQKSGSPSRVGTCSYLCPQVRPKGQRNTQGSGLAELVVRGGTARHNVTLMIVQFQAVKEE